MRSALLTEPDDQPASPNAPYMSYSRLSRYLLCPEQYRLYYVENLRPRSPSANLVFGQIVHLSLAHFFDGRGEPVPFFLENWQDAKDANLSYSAREPWDKLLTVGQSLLEKFVREEAPRITCVRAVERAFRLDITSLDLPFVGVIDLCADVDGKATVVDFKTAAATYDEHEVELSDQLTSYQLAEPDARQLALCVLVKTKEPRIEWHFTTRSAEQFAEFLTKADLIARDIAQRRFYKRPGKWCAWCDYLPVCLRDERRIRETLIQIQVS